MHLRKTKKNNCFFKPRPCRVKLVFHQATFFARSDFRLLKLNSFLISSSRELTKQKKKSLRAKKIA